MHAHAQQALRQGVTARRTALVPRVSGPPWSVPSTAQRASAWWTTDRHAAVTARTSSAFEPPRAPAHHQLYEHAATLLDRAFQKGGEELMNACTQRNGCWEVVCRRILYDGN